MTKKISSTQPCRKNSKKLNVAFLKCFSIFTTYSLLTSVVLLTNRRCSAVQPFNSTIKVITYAVLAVRIYKRINQSMK